MANFAYYRLPYSDSYTAIESEHEPLILPSYESVGGTSGFVIAPFVASDDCPIILIRPDSISRNLVGDMQHGDIGNISDISNIPEENKVCNSIEKQAFDMPSDSYTQAFDAYHDAVCGKDICKLVLARRKSIAFSKNITIDDAKGFFHQACLMYPRLMIMLFSTPLTGTWIVASPEILVEGQAETYHTVALAGTMPYREGYLDWSEKNKAEQHIVEQYIADTLSPLCSDILKDGPVTSRAGNLVHLRSDFRFHLGQEAQLGSLVSKLHPTPAVCGLPKQEARTFILTNENLSRRYYSGFAGPVGIDNGTHLYVSLRCAELIQDKAILYAGGGIMPSSTCASEWQETESKMCTIGNVLRS